ncbi:MAG TPA: MG2 domain-containing protein [Anaeromyxobacteraceae bacterium]|nr:MG2 domain-containing protein [Anaeromyxobacteraceae bacterium]
MSQLPRLAKPLAAALLALLPALAPAKPLYITVNRSFGTEERPVVDVAFERRGPVELRVVKPDSLDAFLARQASLRRAYEQPETHENPGRFLSRGMNAVRPPGTFLYRALGEDFRRALAPALPKRPEEPAEARPISTLAEGPEKLVGLPPGTTLVTRQWLNLDLGGQGRDFTVPGFDLYQRTSGWEERKVALDLLPAGLYVLQLVQGRVEGQVVLVVTDLEVQVKQTDGDVLVRVAGKNLAPVEGAEVRIRTAAGAGPAHSTDAKGEVHLAAREPRLLVLASAGGDTAVVDTDFYSTLAAAPDVFVYSDRPIYRPGDAVQFRGIVRKPDAFLSRLFAPREREVTVALTVAEGREVKTRARVDEFGSFSGALEVPGDVGTGVVRLTATLDGQPHGAEARVEEYVKPTFYVEVLGQSESVRPGDKLTAKVRARRFAGGPPAGARYELFLYRSLVDAPAWVDDAALGGQGSAVTYGSASTTEGKLSVPVRLYSSVDARGLDYGADPWATAVELGPTGEADVAVTVPPLGAGDDRFPWRYSLSVRVRDDQGTFANGSRAWFLAPTDVVGTVLPGAVVTVAGTPVPLAVRSTGLSGAPYAGATGTVEYVLRKAGGDEKRVAEMSFTTGPDGVWRDELPAPGAGTVLARVTLKDQQGRPWSGEGSVLVAGAKGEEAVRVPSLQVASRAAPLAPGDQAEVVALLPAGWGPGGKDAGKVWITLTGTGIFESKLVDVDGLSLVHRFEVERRFGSAVYVSVAHPTPAGRWVERTAAFRIVPPERVLAVAVSPERPEAEPLCPQTLALRVTDHRGKGVRAQVSIGVVDKAIYSLQGEFRPKALEFFYPLVRNNVATFTSADFQAYGYGELLARALGRPGQAFAAVKPPVKAREVDTAYWNPGVVTDEDGRAQVSFTLPKNQTLWTVTAVAADVSGRFGEATSEFAARGGTLLVASAPQFLREGDRATGSVRVARGEKGGAEKLELTVALDGALAGAGVKETVALPPKGERLVPFTLDASKVGAGRIALGASGGDRPLADRRGLPVRSSAIEDVVAVASFGGGRLELPLPQGAEVEEVSLSLRPSTVALALAQVDDLLTYPHGCLEQLVATTIPNVALLRVLEQAGAIDGLDAPSRALLAEARSRSVQGVERILALARQGGGFTWFSGYDTTSVPLTLIALDGLSHAVDAGLVNRAEPRLVESTAWLAGREGLSLPMDAARAYVLARLEGPRQAARVRALLDRVADQGQPDLFPVAMAALAAERAGIAAEAATHARLVALAARANAAVVQPAAWRSDVAYFDYPLRRAGLTAVLAHAASLEQVDVAMARRRLFEALADRSALSTFERATVILHSLWLVERDARLMRAGPAPAVEVDGGSAPRFQPKGGGLAATLDAAVRGVKVAAFDGQAELRARIRVPAAKAPPVAEGMSVERAYYRLLPGGSRKALQPGEKVAQGEELFVELSLDAHDGEPWRSIRSAYYVVEDPVPAGFTPLGEDKIYRGAPYELPIAHEALKRRSLSPERAVFYFEEPAFWSRTPRKVGYVIRAAFPGRFGAPAPTIEDMYAPRVHGRGAPAVLEVVASAAR